MTDRYPRDGEHRGVELFAGQTPERVAAVVKPEIDLVLSMTDVAALAGWAADADHCPESRLLAAALCRAMADTATDGRRRVPVDLERVQGSVAGLDSLKWFDPTRHRSLLDVERY